MLYRLGTLDTIEDLALPVRLLYMLSGLAGLMGMSKGDGGYESGKSLLSYSLTQSLIASSNFEALKRVDLYGMPAIVLSVSKTLFVISV